MRILITGANGQLGRELQRVLHEHDLSALSHSELDITNGAAVTTAIDSFRPNVVVHSAALTDTTRCELRPEVALQVNAVGPENVARACATIGASMAYVSTNEVFDGAKRTPYIETDATGPVNEYGRSKLEGERLVQAALPQHYVVRTAWVYGTGGDNFVGKVLHWAEAGRFTGVTDEIATPTWARDLANAIAQLIETERYGVFHLSNAGEASRYVWALEILRLTGKTKVDIEPITTAQFRASLAADAVVPNKPAYSVLGNTTAAELGITMRSWQEALSAYLSEDR